MKRHLIKQLASWKTKKGRKPLILKGVRQTGKTYLLEQFGREHFSRYHVINFEKQPEAAEIFQKDFDPKRIMTDLQFFLGTPIDIAHDMLLFDEIQACPGALTSLKYFCEDLPELALCSAGSLLGLHLSDGSYPVGKVDMLHLFPMTFSEFLLGVGDEQAYAYFQAIHQDTSISSIVHERLWAYLKQYFITGGLPEVVAKFAEHQDDLYRACYEVRQKQAELINAYYADIAKHSGKVNAMHIDCTWRVVPKQLAQTETGNAARFRFKDVLPNANRYAQLVNVIDWLEAAELVIKIPMVDSVRQPLMAHTKDNLFKLMLFDVGILGSMMDLAPELILGYDYGSYKGFFAENFVAQQLITSGHSPLSWQHHRAEVEFLIQRKGQVYPVEVKAGQVTRAKSLHQYIDKYTPEKSFLLSGKNMNIGVGAKLFQLPLYLAERLFLDENNH